VNIKTESTFEAAIETHLLEHGWLHGKPAWPFGPRPTSCCEPTNPLEVCPSGAATSLTPARVRRAWHVRRGAKMASSGKNRGPGQNKNRNIINDLAMLRAL
jgi:hypothetical protein